jgi:hypothetical protein
MEHYAPVSAAIGGVLIGLTVDRIAGISGIIGSLWTSARALWRLPAIMASAVPRGFLPTLSILGHRPERG